MKKVLFAALAFAALAACTKEYDAAEPVIGKNISTVNASVESLGTKAVFENDKTMKWQEGDQIGLYVYSTTKDNTSEYNPWIAPYTLSEGAGSANGKFTHEFADESLGETYGNVAIYPYADGSVFHYDESTGGTLDLYMPSQWEADDLTTVRMPMIAALDMSEGADKGTFTLMHVGGAIKITVKNVPAEAKYIKLSAGGMKLAGKFSGITVKEAGKAVIETAETSAYEEQYVQLNLPDGFEFAESQDFYFPVPTGTYSALQLDIYSAEASDNLLYSMSAKCDNTVERCTILRMPELDAAPVQEEGHKIYVLDETGWDKLYVYAWKTGMADTDIFGSWSGSVMTKTVSFGEYTYKVIGIPESIEGAEGVNFIFNNAEGTQVENFDVLKNQTVDKDIYYRLNAKMAIAITDPENPEEFPAEPDPVEGWNIIGIDGNWSDDVLMEDKTVGSVTYRYAKITVGESSPLKFRKDGSWDENLGGIGDNTVTIVLDSETDLTAGGQNFEFSAAGDYDVYLDADSKKAWFLTAGDVFIPRMTYHSNWSFGVSYGAFYAYNTNLTEVPNIAFFEFSEDVKSDPSLIKAALKTQTPTIYATTGWDASYKYFHSPASYLPGSYYIVLAAYDENNVPTGDYNVKKYTVDGGGFEKEDYIGTWTIAGYGTDERDAEILEVGNSPYLVIAGAYLPLKFNSENGYMQLIYPKSGYLGTDDEGYAMYLYMTDNSWKTISHTKGDILGFIKLASDKASATLEFEDPTLLISQYDSEAGQWNNYYYIYYYNGGYTTLTKK